MLQHEFTRFQHTMTSNFTLHALFSSHCTCEKLTDKGMANMLNCSVGVIVCRVFARILPSSCKTTVQMTDHSLLPFDKRIADKHHLYCRVQGVQKLCPPPSPAESNQVQVKLTIAPTNTLDSKKGANDWLLKPSRSVAI